MKALLTFLVSSLPFITSAQNWQCLQSGVKRYFTNSGGYLRGMRIDSVRSSGGSTIYYPYHTPRGFYLSNPNLDSTGGSWLGKAVVQRGSIFVFDNIWHDSTVINTQAGVGTTWTFYQDTTPLYYNATILAADTMTVLGTTDSIKKILITAHDPSGIVTTDIADSSQIILSKNHGFVQVFDLYTFPYHKPDSAFTHGIDFYLDLVRDSVFTLTDVYNPAFMQMVSWNVGDAFEHMDYNYALICSLVYQQSMSYRYDSIISINTFPDHIEYGCVGWAGVQDCFHSTSSYAVYDTVTTHYIYSFYNNKTVIDTTLMPEEFKQGYLISYIPNDTSYCLRNTAWNFYGNRLLGATYPTFWENDGPLWQYKDSLGLAKYYFESPPGLIRGDSEIIYYRRSGIPCGNYYFPPIVTGVNDLRLTNDAFSFFPNPATDELYIKTNSIQSYSVTLINMVGQKIKTFTGMKHEASISMNDIPAGVYNICINTESGETLNHKVVVVH